MVYPGCTSGCMGLPYDKGPRSTRTPEVVIPADFCQHCRIEFVNNHQEFVVDKILQVRAGVLTNEYKEPSTEIPRRAIKFEAELIRPNNWCPILYGQVDDSDKKIIQFFVWKRTRGVYKIVNVNNVPHCLYPGVHSQLQGPIAADESGH